MKKGSAISIAFLIFASSFVWADRTVRNCRETFLALDKATQYKVATEALHRAGIPLDPQSLKNNEAGDKVVQRLNPQWTTRTVLQGAPKSIGSHSWIETLERYGIPLNSVKGSSKHKTELKKKLKLASCEPLNILLTKLKKENMEIGPDLAKMIELYESNSYMGDPSDFERNPANKVSFNLQWQNYTLTDGGSYQAPLPLPSSNFKDAIRRMNYLKFLNEKDFERAFKTLSKSSFEMSTIQKRIQEIAEIRNILILSNTGLIRQFFSDMETRKKRIPENWSAALLILDKCVQNYDVTRGEFSTYAMNALKFELPAILLDEKKSPRYKLVDDIVPDDDVKVSANTFEAKVSGLISSQKLISTASQPQPLQEDSRQLLLQSLDGLNPYEKEIIELKFGLTGKAPMSCEKIAELKGKAPSGVYAILGKALKKLQDDQKVQDLYYKK